MLTSLEDAVDTSRKVRKVYGDSREVYVSEFVLMEMLGKGAQKLKVNVPSVTSSEVDIYRHSIKYKGGVFTCRVSEHKI